MFITDMILELRIEWAYHRMIKAVSKRDRRLACVEMGRLVGKRSEKQKARMERKLHKGVV